MRSNVGRALAAILAVTALAGVLRFWDLGHPPERVFDEFYYAPDGCWHAGLPFTECGLDSDVERSWVHPPLGKQLIAQGIDAFGYDPFGWRVAAAVAGTLTVALIGALGFLLTGGALWAGIAGLLLATEHLHLVQSRVAMLDVFLAMFVALGFLLLVMDRIRYDRALGLDARRGPSTTNPAPLPELQEARVGAGDLAPSPLDDLEPPPESWAAPPLLRERHVWRPLRLLAGAAFGAAVAVKWSGILGLLGAALLTLAWERTRRRRMGRRHPLLGAILRETPGLLVAFAAVPFLVYLATWIPWLNDRGFDLGEWFGHHVDMASFHIHLSTLNEQGEPIHPYMSRAWTWFLLIRPVSYYWQGDPDCCAQILGIGNPVLFWGAILVVPALAVGWAVRRDWRAGAIVVPILVQYLPWLLASRPAFLFYMTPVTPFLALGAAHAIRDLAPGRLRAEGRLGAAAAAVVLLSVAVFAYFWPILVGDPISLRAWRMRIWFPSWT